MMFGRESDQQPTHSQYSTTSQGRRENSSTTSPPGTIETMRNILDTIIPTQVCSFLVILFLHLYKIPRLEVNHFWQNNFLRCATLQASEIILYRTETTTVRFVAVCVIVSAAHFPYSKWNLSDENDINRVNMTIFLRYKHLNSPPKVDSVHQYSSLISLKPSLG